MIDSIPIGGTASKSAGVGAAATGAVEVTTGAVSKGVRVATRQLTQLQQMLGDSAGKAAEALGNALSNLGGPEAAAGLAAAPDIFMQLVGGLL